LGCRGIAVWIGVIELGCTSALVGIGLGFVVCGCGLAGGNALTVGAGVTVGLVFPGGNNLGDAGTIEFG
jgi:hypothetical protein